MVQVLAMGMVTKELYAESDTYFNCICDVVRGQV